MTRGRDDRMQYRSHGTWKTEVDALRRASGRSARNRASATKEIRGEVEVLRAEVEFLSLVLTSVVAQLDAKGVVDREDLRALMAAADDFDGQVDGRLPVRVLEELLAGDQPEPELASEADTPPSDVAAEKPAPAIDPKA